jgi:ABC-2 type transport system ATP-binding protein
VRVTAGGLKPADLKMAGISNVQSDDGTVSFFFKGDINAVVKKIGGLKLEDVTIEEPSLEEIFMHYYE